MIFTWSLLSFLLLAHENLHKCFFPVRTDTETDTGLHLGCFTCTTSKQKK